jgi:hypothetical protein
MQKYHPTVKLYLDTRKPLVKRPGQFTIKARITHRRISRYYVLPKVDGTPLEHPYSCTRETWDRMYGANSGARLRDWEGTLKRAVDAGLERMRKIAYSVPVFSFSDFNTALSGSFSDAPTDSTRLLDLFDRKIKALEDAGKISTATSYRTAKNSILTDNKNLSLEDITRQWLQAYERKRRGPEDNNTDATTGVYLRNLRAIFRQAIADKIIDAGLYPFGRDGYTIPTVTNEAEPLTSEQVKQIVHATGLTPGQEEGRDLWIFTLLLNGANLVDVSGLRYKDVGPNSIKFMRTNTRDTVRTRTTIEVPNDDPMRRIIVKWGNPHRHRVGSSRQEALDR